LGVEALVCGW
jgi:hypothetical protein